MIFFLAMLALDIVKKYHIKMAVLKSGSPSCGNVIYDGNFTGKKVAGLGIVAYSLENYGVKVFNELQLEQAARYFKSLLTNA